MDNIFDLGNVLNDNSMRWKKDCMIRAAEEKKWDQVLLLMVAGVKVRSYNSGGRRTLLQMACSDNSIPLIIVEMMIKSGADVHKIVDNKTAFNYATEANNIDVVKLLIKLCH